MKDKINIFLWRAYKKKEMKLIDIYFSKLFDFKNDKYSYIYILFSSIISLSNRLGHICLSLDNIFNNYIFTDFIKKFLYYFFENFLSLKKCLNIMLNNNIISLWYKRIYTPFILYNNSIYLYKFWYYENYIIKFFNKNIYVKLNKNINIYNINKYIKKLNININYKNIILSSIYNKITIISGNPGTGKSTLIIKLIIILYEVFNFNIRKNIILVSPTGKSSVLLTNYLNKIFNKFNISNSLRKILPNKSITIHKFLNFNFKLNYIKFNKFNKFNIDYLIIDEFSMINLNIIFLILSSLNSYTKLILVGDFNQISSIEPGNFFYEIFIYINNNFYNNNNYYYYKKNIFILNSNYRFLNNNDLYNFIIYIKNKNFIKLDNYLLNNNFSYNVSFYDSYKFNYSFFLKLCINYYNNYINLIINNFNKNNLFKVFNINQIICLLKDTNYGIYFINNYINKYLIDNKLVKYVYLNKKLIFIGEPILINKNNVNINLFNGDLGFFIFDKYKELRFFYNKKKELLHPYILNNNWNDCWAITVHKSQGSEYDNIFFVLPENYINILDNRVIYTALSRAKKNILIYGNLDILIKGIYNNNIKFNNIKNRLYF